MLNVRGKFESSNNENLEEIGNDQFGENMFGNASLQRGHSSRIEEEVPDPRPQTVVAPKEDRNCGR